MAPRAKPDIEARAHPSASAQLLERAQGTGHRPPNAYSGRSSRLVIGIPPLADDRKQATRMSELAKRAYATDDRTGPTA